MHAEEEPPLAPLTHQCTLCHQHFASFHGLTSHLHKWHGIKNLARRYAISNTCRHCLMTYDNRENLVQHLKHLQTGCLISLIQTVVPLSQAEVQDLDQEYAQVRKELKRTMRNKRFRFPPQRSSGPRRPPLWRSVCTMDFPDGLSSDPAAVTAWVQASWNALSSLDTDLLHETLQQQPCTSLHLRSLLAVVDHNLQTCAPEVRIHLTLSLDGALSEWVSAASLSHLGSDGVLSWRSCVSGSQWQLLADVRVPQAIGSTGPACDPNNWLRILSEPYHVVVQIQQQHRRDLAFRVQWPRVAQLLCRRTFVVAYLFSGRRRNGDFMSQVQQIGDQFGLTVSVLLVDNLALSEQHDMLDPQKYKWLKDRLQAQEISAVLAAPPCETWSRARNNQLSTTNGGPRVLRTPQSPWGKEGLKTTELRQLAVANALMFVTLQLAVICLSIGTPFVMEHPDDPGQEDLVSVWRTWPIQWLLQHAMSKLHKLSQSQYGSPYRKPTGMLSLWMPHFYEDMQVHTEPTPRWALKHLSGVDASGFTTRLAKEYPPMLNRSLAYSFVQEELRRWQRSPPSHEISAELCCFIQSLEEAQRPISEQELQPDYARGRQ